MNGTRPDYVKHGSDRHAALLGLKKAQDGDAPALKGYALEDITQYGPAASEKYLEAVLRQKVNELTTPMPAVQSDDPSKPHYAPPMFVPGASSG